MAHGDIGPISNRVRPTTIDSDELNLSKVFFILGDDGLNAFLAAVMGLDNGVRAKDEKFFLL
jgi:hypothetical protein